MVFRKRRSASETYGFPGEFQRHRRKRVLGRLAAGALVFILGMVMTFVPIKKRPILGLSASLKAIGGILRYIT